MVDLFTAFFGTALLALCFLLSCCSVVCLWSRNSNLQWSGRLLMFLTCLISAVCALAMHQAFFIGFDLILAFYFGRRAYLTIADAK